MNALLATLLGAVFAPLLFGAGIVRLCGLAPARGWRLYLAWSYLLGHFVQAWLTFGWIAAGKPVPGWSLPAMAAAAGLGLLLCLRRRGGAGSPPREAGSPPREAGDPWVRAVVVLLAVVLLDACSLQSLEAILTNDEANIWSAKAWVLYAGADLRALSVVYAQHADYPMLDPMAQVLAFASSGHATWWENRLPVQGFAFALLLLLSVAVERRLPRALAIAVLVAFTASRFVDFAPTVYADVLLAFALLALVDAWLRGQETGELVWWRLGCMAAAAMLATKNEGAMLAVAASVAAVVARALTRTAVLPRPGPAWLWLLVPACTVAMGQWFNAHHGLSNDLTTAADGSGLFGRMLQRGGERVGPVLSHYAGLLVAGDVTRWLVLAALVAPLAKARDVARAAWCWPWLLCVLALGGYVLVFLGTSADSGGPDGPARGLLWHLSTAADRTLLHVLPTAVLTVCTCLGRTRP